MFWIFKKKKIVPHVRLTGIIGSAGRFKQGMDLSGQQELLKKAFSYKKPKHVAIWFGVLFCMNMQVSFLSPPFGPAAFYLKSVGPPHISLTDIFKGFLPFIAIQCLALSILVVYPSIITIFL